MIINIKEYVEDYENIISFANNIDKINGKAYIAGGFVRDIFIGKNSKDIDIVLTGISQDELLSIYPESQKVGNAFPVFLIKLGNISYEVALARFERKVSSGYKGFEVCFNKEITIEQDLIRRDTTMNSMCINILTGQLIDPFNGVNAIDNRTIEATSKHFLDDPVRALRAARQSAQFSFSISESTLQMMNKCEEELSKEPKERINGELIKALNAKHPSLFFDKLNKSGLLKCTFPQIYDLIGKTQPIKYHPEGDAYNHTMIVLDDVASKTKNLNTIFAALVHDIGKGLTPIEELPKHIYHDKNGINALDEMNNELCLRNEFMKIGKFIIKNHMTIHKIKNKSKILKVILDIKRQKLDYKEINIILMSDHGSIPWFMENYEYVINSIKVNGNDAPKDIKGEKIGEWIFKQQLNKLCKTYKILEVEKNEK